MSAAMMRLACSAVSCGESSVIIGPSSRLRTSSSDRRCHAQGPRRFRAWHGPRPQCPTSLATIGRVRVDNGLGHSIQPSLSRIVGCAGPRRSRAGPALFVLLALQCSPLRAQLQPRGALVVPNVPVTSSQVLVVSAALEVCLTSQRVVLQLFVLQSSCCYLFFAFHFPNTVSTLPRGLHTEVNAVVNRLVDPAYLHLTEKLFVSASRFVCHLLPRLAFGGT